MFSCGTVSLIPTHYILVLLSAVATGNALATSKKTNGDHGTCQAISIPFCQSGLHYNTTHVTNLLDHVTQASANEELARVATWLDWHCSGLLRLLLCSIYAPQCFPDIGPIPPCASLCESVHRDCQPVLEINCATWPPYLNCSLFPKDGDGMCLYEVVEEDARPTYPPATSPVIRPTKPTGAVRGAAGQVRPEAAIATYVAFVLFVITLCG